MHQDVTPISGMTPLLENDTLNPLRDTPRLSRGVVWHPGPYLMDAGLPSGTFSTADEALELGKEVGTIPCIIPMEPMDLVLLRINIVGYIL